MQKIRLIGYSTGIPGIFYGPHWNWIIAAVQIFSKNPVAVVFIATFLPYFVLIPYFFYKFKSIFGKLIVALLWLVFILKYYPNSVHLWNIHLAPVLLLAIIYLLINLDLKKIGRGVYLRLIVIGFLVSTLVFLHMSFGLIIAASSFIYLLGAAVYRIRQGKSKTKQNFLKALHIFMPFVIGFGLSSLPFILFEVRHSFIQTKQAIYVVKQSVLYNSSVVGQLGMSKADIAGTFFKLPLQLLNLPESLVLSWWLGVAFIVGYLTLKKRWKLRPTEKRLVIFLSLVAGLMMVIYLNSKNPIWSYQFVGAEIIFLLGIGLIASRSKIFKTLLFVWVAYLSLTNIISMFNVPPPDPLSLDTLNAKRYIVDSIYADAQGGEFAVDSYSPSINTYDYDYLFIWLGKDVYGYEPVDSSQTVYLIIPKTEELTKKDFINNKTPEAEYVTEKEWGIENGTIVVKRMKK